MNKTIRRSSIVAVLACGMASASAAMGADRTAEEILKNLDAVKMPTVDRSKVTDRQYVEQYRKDYQEAVEKRDGLILELYKTDPDNAKLPPLMTERWMRMSPFGPDARKRELEVKEILSHARNPQLTLEATHAKAQAGIFKVRETGSADFTGVNEFIKLAPKDPRAPRLLYTATVLIQDEKAKEAIEERILKEFPDSNVAGRIEGVRRKRNAVGKPFDLEFTDAISGSTVSVKNLKGKVVVVDFWATWCGPCVAEMPHMKELYAKYHDQGVEFIGVSLDRSKEEGGLDHLKEFVKANKIPWPQYYQGNYWDSEFSQSWGINSIPALFIVDPDGKLYSADAREKLNEIIPALLKKRSEGAGSQAGGE